MRFSKIRIGEEETFETIVKDVDGRRIDRWFVMKKDFEGVVKLLIEKYGLRFKVIEQKKDQDLEWAMK